MKAPSGTRGLCGSLSLATTLVTLVAAMSTAALSQDEPRMPSFTLRALDGSFVSNRSLAGNVALIDFWATWCEPCLQEIPQWNALHDRYRRQGLEVLGITVQSGTDAEIRASVEKLDIKYPIVVSDEDVVKGFGGIRGFPATFLVERDGRIYKKYLGQYPSKHAQIERDIQQLLRARPSARNARDIEKPSVAAREIPDSRHRDNP